MRSFSIFLAFRCFPALSTSRGKTYIFFPFRHSINDVCAKGALIAGPRSRNRHRQQRGRSAARRWSRPRRGRGARRRNRRAPVRGARAARGLAHGAPGTGFNRPALSPAVRTPLLNSAGYSGSPEQSKPYSLHSIATLQRLLLGCLFGPSRTARIEKNFANI